MISTKTNSKLPLPERKYKEGVRTFAAHPATIKDAAPGSVIAAAVDAGYIIGDLPESLDRKKHPELNAPRPKSGTVAALAAQIQDPEKRAAVEKVEAEKTAKRSTKRAVKAEKKKAAADGTAKAMPLTGKAAVKAIRKAVKAGTKAAPAKKAAKKAAAPRNGNGNKIDDIAKLLKREKGCTTADILAATGWKAVNVPRQAELAGLKLTKNRDEKLGVTRYFGK